MFYFRVNKLLIIDNYTKGFLFFKKDLANVKLLSLITTGNDDLSDLDQWMTKTDPVEKRTLLSTVVSRVVASRILTEVRRVKDSQSLFFGDTGYVLYQSQQIPQDFNWCFTAVKSRRKTREIGNLLAGVTTDPEFDSFADNLAALVVGAANPAFTAGVEVARFATGIISKILKNAGDDQLGILYMSLNRFEHYLHGERKKDDVNDLTGNIRVDYSLFGFEQDTSA